MPKDNRIKDVLSFYTGLGAGDLDQPDLPISDRDDEIDAISSLGNMLRQELRSINLGAGDFLLDRFPMMAFVLGEHNKIRKANRQAHRCLGYEPGTLVGSSLAALLEDGPALQLEQLTRLFPVDGSPLQVFGSLYMAHGRLPVQLDISKMDERPGEYLVLARETGLDATRDWIRQCIRASQDIGERAKLAEALRVLSPQEGVNPAIAESGITPREMDVLELLSDGLTMEEIAVRFERSLGTVHTHKENLFAKFQVDKVSSLIQHANDLQLIGKFRYGVDGWRKDLEIGRAVRERKKRAVAGWKL